MKGILFLLLLVSFSGNTQILTASELQRELEVVQRQFTQSNSSISYSRELLISGADTTLEKGTLLRGDGVNYRLTQNGVVIVQNSLGKLIIDSVQHTVALTNIDSLFSLINAPDLTDENVGKAYVLSKNSGKTVNTYFLTPKISGIERAEIIIPVKGSCPVTMKVFYPPGNYVSNSLDDQSIEEPVLTISYTSVKAVKPAKSEFSFDRYLTLENGKYQLSGFPADYTFYDLRPDSIK